MDSDATYSNASPSLTGIPAEVREQILVHLVDINGPAVKANGKTSMKDIKSGSDKQTWDLLSTCSVIHQEVERILITGRHYEFSSEAGIYQFLATFEHLNLIKNIQFDKNICALPPIDFAWVLNRLSRRLSAVEKVIVTHEIDNFVYRYDDNRLTWKATLVPRAFVSLQNGNVCLHRHDGKDARDNHSLDRLIFTSKDEDVMLRACEAELKLYFMQGRGPKVEGDLETLFDHHLRLPAVQGDRFVRNGAAAPPEKG